MEAFAKALKQDNIDPLNEDAVVLFVEALPTDARYSKADLQAILTDFITNYEGREGEYLAGLAAEMKGNLPPRPEEK